MNELKEKKYTNIGGQAVIEGVMMRGKDYYSVSVRTDKGEIISKTEKIESKDNSLRKMPVIRGIFAFVDSLILGTKILTYSASFFDLEAEEEDSKFEKFLSDKLGDKLSDFIVIISVILAIAMSIGLFMLLPVLLSSFANRFIKLPDFALGILEGLVRLLIFFLYVVLISFMKDIQRVFMYHGAEHKSIHCLEAGEDLTVENVKKHSRLHKRCGTSFLIFVMLISMFLFLFIKTPNIWMRLLSRIILVPFVAGLSYELIKWTGKKETTLTNLLSKPGLALQKLTTREPDDAQIEVALNSLKAVLDKEEAEFETVLVKSMDEQNESI